MKHRILIIGSGGREHAFAWKMSQSSKAEQIFVAPGNAGTAQVATNIDISVTDFDKLGQFCKEKNISLVVVGPEVPLVEGIRDYFQKHPDLRKILLIGPGKKGAQLEGSKDFSKSFMQRHAIPTAASKTFVASQLEDGLAYLEHHALPVVLKADGLAAGKGVIIASTTEEAKETLRDMLEGAKFGEASHKVVIEEYLQGIELSVFVLTDGTHYLTLPSAKDYKRIGEGDTGPNTGGMGAVSPVPFANTSFMQKVETRIIKPTIEGLAQENIPYTGFVFIGLMNVAGEPYVIEYNARMGDPETEAVLPRIQNDLVEILDACATGKLNEIELRTDPRTATTLVLVAGGYPEQYEKGRPILGLERSKEVLVFHAGTKLDNGQVVTNGGRVLALTAYGPDIKKSLALNNKAAEAIEWEGKYYRRDIGLDLLRTSGSN
jgi:phosphoribosylamine---glycine ligase